jgi:uncharacterized protein with NRDE domain
LILAANRDEYYDRPTAPAAFWEEAPGLLAGRDTRAGGTWLGITTKGRLAAVTNYRDPLSNRTNVPSRGKLASRFLLGRELAVDYLDRLKEKPDDYNGFNLVIGELHKLFWYSNRGGGYRILAPGIYGISNHLLDTPWPKVTRGKEAFQRLISGGKCLYPEAVFDMLSDRSIPDDKTLPDTGVGLEWERILSPLFITSPNYGTRSSTILFIDQENLVTFVERTFNSHPDHAKTVEYEFRIEQVAI